MHNKTSITHYLLPVTLTILLAACGNNPEQVALNTQQDTLSWAMLRQYRVVSSNSITT